MLAPKPPRPEPFSRISPSLYEATRRCYARGAWTSLGERAAVPENPFALLGSCYHEVVAAASRGELASDPAVLADKAGELFDRAAERRFQEAHWLLKAKYGAKERLPFYYLQRERAAARAGLLASYVEAHTDAAAGGAQPPPHRHAVERTLCSRDGLVYGRPDLLDLARKEVVDYKTGASHLEQPEQITDQERRQLLLYAFLATENGMEIRTGAIVRGDGRLLRIELAPDEIAGTAEDARNVLTTYNHAAAAAESFDDLTRPSAENCRSCPCIGFCDSFWSSVRPEWGESIGIHVQGSVKKVASSTIGKTRLYTFDLSDALGSFAGGPDAILEQVPAAWIFAEPDRCETWGPLRALYVQREPNERVTVFRPGRVATVIWTGVSGNGGQHDPCATQPHHVPDTKQEHEGRTDNQTHAT